GRFGLRTKGCRSGDAGAQHSGGARRPLPAERRVNPASHHAPGSNPEAAAPPAGGASDRTRDRDPTVGRRGQRQQGDRQSPGLERRHHQVAPAEHLPQAAGADAGGSGRPGGPARHRTNGRSLSAGLGEPPVDRFTGGAPPDSVENYQGSLRGSREIIVGVVAMKKLLVVVVGLLGAILAGGANISL